MLPNPARTLSQDVETANALSGALCLAPLFVPSSPTTPVSDPRLYLPRKGTEKRYPDEPESYQHAIHPQPLVLRAVPCSVTLITVICEICRAVFFCLVLHSQQGDKDASRPSERNARRHVHARSERRGRARTLAKH